MITEKWINILFLWDLIDQNIQILVPETWLKNVRLCLLPEQRRTPLTWKEKDRNSFLLLTVVFLENWSEYSSDLDISSPNVEYSQIFYRNTKEKRIPKFTSPKRRWTRGRSTRRCPEQHRPLQNGFCGLYTNRDMRTYPYLESPTISFDFGLQKENQIYRS